MLYPLSYEGLRGAFALGIRRVLVRWIRVCYPVTDGLCRICAACRVTAPDHPAARRGAAIVRLGWRVIPAGTGSVKGVVVVVTVSGPFDARHAWMACAGAAMGGRG
jgi:hypothetical protein